MLKNLIVLISVVVLFGACNTGTTNNSKVRQVSIPRKQVKHPGIESNLTDSAKLVKYLRDLPIAKFPFETYQPSSAPGSIDLSAFKDKKLMGLKLKLRYREIGACVIDREEDMPSTFDLADSTYKANWLLIAMKPRFFLVVIDGTLAALTYQLQVIDAMHIEASDPSGNSHFHGILNTTIYKNLTLKLNYYYEVQVDEDGNFDKEIEDDTWTIDSEGHFKFKKTKTDKTLKM